MMDQDLASRFAELDKQHGIHKAMLENHINQTDRWVSEHKELHKEAERERRARNWQMWALLIAVGVAIVVDLIKELQ
jgi:hypothetical protein